MPEEDTMFADVLGAIAVGVLGMLGLLHLYWAARGAGGSTVVIPEVGGRATFTPTRFATLAVAALLFIAALLAFGRLARWGGPHYGWPFVWGTWGVATAFL